MKTLIFLILFLSNCQKVNIPNYAANTILGQILRKAINPVPTMEVVSLSKKVNIDSTIQLGSKVINSSSNPRQITINNKSFGYLSLNEQKVYLEGDSQDFTLEQDSLSKDIPAQGGSSFNLYFTPKTAGNKKVKIIILNNSGNSPNFSFNAEGIATLVPEAYLQISNSTDSINSGFEIDFGSKPTGYSSEEVKFTIYNFGSDSLVLSPLVISGTNSNQYGIIQPFPTTVAIDQSVTFSIQYRPVSVGDKSDTLLISSNDTRTPNFSIKLKAEATPGPEPRMVLYRGSNQIPNNSTYNFGNIPQTRQSGNISFSILNNGSANLFMNGQITISGVNTSDFSISQAFPSFAKPGEYMNFTVNFIPQALGTRTAIISIPTNDPTLPALNFSVTGTGDPVPAPVISVDNYPNNSNYSFGSHTLGSSPYPEFIFTIRNLGNDTLSLTESISATGDTNDFIITQPFPSTIPTNGTVTFKVNFIPTVVTTRNIILTIKTNDQITPNYIINLSGTGLAGSDTSPPVLGNSSISYTILSSTSVRLNWNLALADDNTPQSNLTYQVYCSPNSANVANVTSMNANSSSACTSSITNINTIDITNLSPNTGYSFNIIVRDSMFNGTAYTAIRLAAITSVTATNTNGGYSLGQIINIRINFSDIVTVSGTPGLALNSGASVNYSSGSGTNQLNFNYTINTGEASTDLNYIDINSLTGGTILHSGNQASLFLPATNSTNSLGGSKNILIDTVAPTLSSGANISFSTIQARNLNVNWAIASDNISPTANLEYKIVRSATSINNLTDANSATLVLAYTPNITTSNVTGLTPDTSYFFAVVVRDQAGNETLYNSSSVTTLFYRISLLVEGLTGSDSITITNTVNSNSAIFNSVTSSAILPAKLGNGDNYNLTATADPASRHCVWVGNPTGVMPAANLTIRRRCFGGANITIPSFVSTISPININGTGLNLVNVPSGTNISVSYDFSVSDGGCTSCVSPLVSGVGTQRFNPSPHCGGNTSTLSFNSNTINVSGTPGTIIYIRAWNAWDYCSTMEPNFNGTQGQIIGVIIIN